MKIQILVEVDVNDRDEVKTKHRPLTSEDVRLMQTLPSGGVVQVAHALFIEALRREGYTMAISLLSTGKDLDDLTVEDLDGHIKAHWIKMLDQFGAAAADETLKMLQSQITSEGQ